MFPYTFQPYPYIKTLTVNVHAPVNLSISLGGAGKIGVTSPILPEMKYYKRNQDGERSNKVLYLDYLDNIVMWIGSDTKM